METDEGIWGTVVMRLGALASDERPNVRCNRAMLAGALAPTDRSAFDELVGIALTSINRLLREDAPAEEDVLETVVDEREALPEACQARFDSTVGTKLVESGQLAGFDPAVEGVLRLPQRALHLLPPQVIASAILSEARRLAPELIRTEDALGRDRRRSRLVRITQLFESNLPAVRDDIQAFLGKGIDALSSAERRAVVLALLLVVPRLLQRTQAGRHPVSMFTLCGGARRVRPKAVTLIGLSIVRSLIPATCLTGLMALKIALWGSFGADGVESVLGAWFELTLIACAAAGLTALGFVPSVGRFLSGLYFNASNIGAAILGSVSAVAVSLLYAGTLYKEVPLEAALGWALLEMMAVLIPTVCLAAPTVQLFQGRHTDYRWALMVACVTGPGIVIATAVAAYAELTLARAMVPFWPITIVATFSVGFTVVALESLAWPTPPATAARPQAPLWRWILLSAAVVPEILFAVGLTRAGIDRAAIRPQVLMVPQQDAKPEPKVLNIRPDRRVELRLQGVTFPVAVRVGIDPGPAPYTVLANLGGIVPERGVYAAATGTERQFVFHDTTGSLCLNTCGPTWPPMERWLAVLWGGRSPPAKLTIQVVPRRDTVPSNGGEGLMVASNGTIDNVPLTAGGFRTLTLNEPSHVTLKASGAGKFGSAPLLAAFSSDGSSNTWTGFFPEMHRGIRTVDDRPGNYLDFDLPGGSYLLCVYFGGADLAGCPANDTTPAILFEPGTATLSGSVKPLHYAFGNAEAPVSGDGNTELTLTVAMNQPVWLTLPISNTLNLAFPGSVRDAGSLQVEINQENGEPAGMHPSITHGHLKASATLQAGKYWLCLNTGGPCGVGEAGPPVTVRATFVNPFNKISQHVGP